MIGKYRVKCKANGLECDIILYFSDNELIKYIKNIKNKYKRDISITIDKLGNVKSKKYYYIEV